MNSVALKAIEEDIKLTNDMIESCSVGVENLKKQPYIKQRHLRWLECLRDFAKEQGIDFDFLVIKANQFNSGFGKLAFENIEIVFPGLTSSCNFKKVTNALSAQKSEREKFYYIFYRREDRNCQVDAKRLASKTWSFSYAGSPFRLTEPKINYHRQLGLFTENYSHSIRMLGAAICYFPEKNITILYEGIQSY